MIEIPPIPKSTNGVVFGSLSQLDEAIEQEPQTPAEKVRHAMLPDARHRTLTYLLRQESIERTMAKTVN